MILVPSPTKAALGQRLPVLESRGVAAAWETHGAAKRLPSEDPSGTWREKAQKEWGKEWHGGCWEKAADKNKLC